MPIDAWSLRPEWPARDRGPIVTAAVRLDLVQDSGQLLAYCCEVRRPAHRAAVGVDRDFIELAERALQCRERLLDLAHARVRHSEVENYGC